MLEDLLIGCADHNYRYFRILNSRDIPVLDCYNIGIRNNPIWDLCKITIALSMKNANIIVLHSCPYWLSYGEERCQLACLGANIKEATHMAIKFGGKDEDNQR